MNTAPVPTIRQAAPPDLAYLIASDLATGRFEDTLLGDEPWQPTPLEAEAQAANVARYLSDPGKTAWVGVGPDDSPLAMLLARVRDLNAEPIEYIAATSIFLELDRRLFPTDGRFCEIFQLWVEPACRRRGWAMALKRHLEADARRRGVGAIYTHTLEANVAVVELNLKLGYHVVRNGPIWDEATRVSFIKALA